MKNPKTTLLSLGLTALYYLYKSLIIRECLLALELCTDYLLILAKYTLVNFLFSVAMN
jgi:hypothetical protein